MVIGQEKGIRVIAAVSEALNYRKNNKTASEEKIIGHILKFVKSPEYKNDKENAVAGVSFALKLLEKNPKLKDREVISQVMLSLDKIIISRD